MLRATGQMEERSDNTRGKIRAMRIVSYNILDGGSHREDLLRRTLEAQRPDVVCLVEAEDAAIVERLAGALDMDLIHAPGNKKASALLSRFAIVQTINHAPLHRAITKSLLEAVVQPPLSGELTFGVLHLHAHAAESDERTRETEIAEILQIFEPHRAARRPHILAGDFNSNAPSQRIDPEKLKKSSRKEWEANGNQIPRRVIQRVLDAGYTDTLHAVRPEQAETTGTFSTQHPGQRVDFLFTFGIDKAQIRDAWIVRDQLAEEASDHFPIGVVIESIPQESPPPGV